MRCAAMLYVVGSDVFFLSSKGASGVSPARKGRVSECLDSSPNGASGLVLDAHFGASGKRHRNLALKGQANTGRPVGPKTSSHQITITLGHAKYISLKFSPSNSICFNRLKW